MAQYPTAAGTDSNLFVAKNNLQTTLNGAIDDTTTTVILTDASSFPTTGYVTIDTEAIKYTGKSTNTLTGVTRGADGTTAASHLTLAQVFHTVMADHHNILKDEVKAVEGDLVAAFGAVTPAGPNATDTTLALRIASILKQLKDGFGLTNWYDAIASAMMPKSGGAFTGDVTGLTAWGYRQPNLKWINATTVDIENNTGTANQTTVLFRDGTTRSVTEDTSSTNKYRRFDITATAEFTSGTEDSGLRSSLSEGNNTKYAIYAVKSAINSAKFVLVGDTTPPLQANYATLNSAYGVNGWVYIGSVWNGDGGTSAADIMKFTQAGNRVTFRNVLISTDIVSVQAASGFLLAKTAGATSLAWVYSAGMTSTSVPGNILVGSIVGARASPSSIKSFQIGSNTGAPPVYFYQTANNDIFHESVADIPLEDGIALASSTTSVALAIVLTGYIDSVLGVGVNPGV